jgi:hypothetical protein
MIDYQREIYHEVEYSNTTIDLKFSESASYVRLSAYQFKWLNIANDAAPTVLID